MEKLFQRWDKIPTQSPTTNNNESNNTTTLQQQSNVQNEIAQENTTTPCTPTKKAQEETFHTPLHGNGTQSTKPKNLPRTTMKPARTLEFEIKELEQENDDQSLESWGGSIQSTTSQKSQNSKSSKTTSTTPVKQYFLHKAILRSAKHKTKKTTSRESKEKGAEDDKTNNSSQNDTTNKPDKKHSKDDSGDPSEMDSADK